MIGINVNPESSTALITLLSVLCSKFHCLNKQNKTNKKKKTRKTQNTQLSEAMTYPQTSKNTQRRVKKQMDKNR